MRTLEQHQLADQYKAMVKEERREAKAKRPAPVNPDSPGQRQPRVRDKSYLAWLRRLPCAAGALGDCSGPIEAAHVRFSSAAASRRNPGMGQKPDDRCAVPLCAGHHRVAPNSQHSMNEARFWSMVRIDPAILCLALGLTFDNQQDGAAVIRKFVEGGAS